MKWFSCLAPSGTLDKDEAHHKIETTVIAASPFASQSPPSRTDVDRERRTLSFTLTPTHPDTAPPPPPNPPEGIGVRLPDGSAYFGEINKDGKMHGRGVFVWPDGDRYEGEWLDGLQKGIGTFISSTGGAYFGNWEAGQPHGRGVFRPAPSPSPPIVTATAATTTADDNLAPHPPQEPQHQHQQPTMLNDNNIVYLREYRHGELLNEEVLRIAEQDVRKGSKEKKEGRKKAREVVGATSSGISSSRKKYTPPRSGERIYKNHPSYELMRELQLGLMFSMAQGWPKTGKLLKESFEEEVVQWFPMSSGTPPFKWKSYAPSVFHRLRELFGIDNTDYLLSLTGEAALRELPTPGRSGSMFYLSDDDRFLVKTVRKEEMRLLLRMIEHYHDYVCDHSQTLLAKFLGIHRVSPWGGRNIRFIVMGNVLPSDLRLHRRYDLKGSSYGRTVGEERRRTDPDVTLQDNDLDMHFIMAPALRERLLAQLRLDCAFLTSLKSIDYSLLLGVHFLCWGNGEWHPPGESWPDGGLSPRLVLPLYASPSLAKRQYSTESNAFDANITDGGDGDGDGGGGESPDAASMLAQHQHHHQRMNISNRNSRINSLTMTQEQFLSSYKLSNMSDTVTGGAALTQKHQHQQNQQHTPLASSSTMSTPYVSGPLPVTFPSGQQLQQEGGRPGGTVQVTPTAHPLTTALLHPPNITTDTTIVPSRRPTLLRSTTKDGAGWGGRLNSLREARKLAALMQAGGPELAHAAVLLEDANSARNLARKSAANASAYIAAAVAAAASTGNEKTDGNDGTDGNIAADGHFVPHNDDIVLNLPVAKKPTSLGFTTTTTSNSTISSSSSRPASPTTKFNNDTTKSDGNGSKAPAVPGVAVPLYVPYWKSDTYSEQLEVAMASPPPSPPSPSPSPVKRGTSTITTTNNNNNKIKGGMKEDEGPLSWSASMMMRNRDGGGGGDIFGRAVPAMAVSKAGGHAEPVLLFFGIIDFLQSYTARKMVERAFKVTIHDGDSVSVANPKLYSERFMHAMEKILVSDTLQ